ncbi:PROTEIN REGULATOR OF CYTOKINESIS 1 PRC1-RELATED [Salix viminalis]|uniref:PROTEIN REGULATOR OF CYTOKINESIS 1 PRC1-RELATED n=1 Tax=Salix viminalis TaxID=40686 RepID=A0A9Q0TLG9_SALVM|nr:PROTEIN REGULATOR OF CYTOKINESIS 1 PRC1-RELATED [Salix viminalis]
MASFQIGMRSSALLESSCGYLLQELQMIWDEVGEDQFEREKVLVDLEQQCLEVYRRKVDNANISRARLHQELAESEAEFTHLLLSLGERSLPGRPERKSGTLKEQLDAITPALQEMRSRKEERVNQFRSVQGQIQKISAEIAGQSVYDDSITNVKVNENDLSLKKLEEYQIELQRLHNEKNDRLQLVDTYIDTIHDLSSTLGMESSMIITKVHPTLNELCGISKNISDSILDKLNSTVESLKEEKQKRLEKLHQLGKALKNLWNLMDTPYKDCHSFSNVTDLLSLSPAEVSDPGSLALNIIQQAEAEVKRLDQLKASKMKELFFKKQSELDQICKKSHMEIPSQPEMENIVNLINLGEIDHADLLMSLDEQISRAKEEASSRKAIMEKVERWILARDEERWLEEYSMDEKRYSVRRGAHKNLQRAERARVIVNKIPGKKGKLVGLLRILKPQWACNHHR